MEVVGPRSWLGSFSCISVSLCYLFASFNDLGEDSIAPGVSSSWHCRVSPVRWRAVSYSTSFSEEYSCRCATFASPSHIQEGAYHSLSVRTVSCLQGRLEAMASSYSIRSVVICLLAFAAFLRFDELATLVRSDVKIESDVLKLFIQSSQTDQYRDGAWIVIASSGKTTSPVAMIGRYVERAGLSYNSPLFLSAFEN